MTQGDIRLSLQPEASGQASIVTTVSDSAGNTWSETFIVNVDNIDDSPNLREFPALIPVELAVASTFSFDYSDVDSTGLTATTNKSWATVDVFNKTITVVAPVLGFTSVLVSLCDQTSCSERILDLEVLSLPDLVIEEIDVIANSNTVRSGDILSIRVLVRNLGQAEANMISVRCEAGSELIDYDTLPQLQPGTVSYVTFDWQVPDGMTQVQLRAIVDRSSEIAEGDESNNEALLAVAIEPSLSSESEKDETSALADGLFWGSSILVIVAIGVAFVFFMPAKIKKLE